MERKEKIELMTAFDAVFDSLEEVKPCGRDACIRLIKLMKAHTQVNVGNENTGTLKINELKEEYWKLMIQ